MGLDSDRLKIATGEKLKVLLNTEDISAWTDVIQAISEGVVEELVANGVVIPDTLGYTYTENPAIVTGTGKIT